MTTTAIPQSWDGIGLAACGYVGFEPLLSLRHDHVPDQPGTYMVMRLKTMPPTILEARRADPPRVRGKVYSAAELRDRWRQRGISGPVLYIGKADNSLRTRLRLFKGSGLGTKSNHEGGKSLWWLADAEDLIVAWRPLDVDQRHGFKPAERHEDELLLAFMRDHGGDMPWANVQPPSLAARAQAGH